MSDLTLDFRSRAAVERVRVAIHAAGPVRMSNVVGYARRTLEARARGELLRTIAEREGLSRQGVHYRVRKFLRLLGR